MLKGPATNRTLPNSLKVSVFNQQSITCLKMIFQFIKMSVPLFLYFSLIFSLTYIKHLNVLEFLGLNFSLGFSLHFLNKICLLVYDSWLGNLLGHNTDLVKMGSWAVVTGATDGIGLAYSRELAKRGLNLILMSRSLSRLENCASTLEKEFGIETKVIDVDFTGNIDIYERIEQKLSGMDIGTLVNNVGMTFSSPEHFHYLEDSKNFIHDMININVLAMTMMTRAVLPGMLERGKGVIVNVGSIVSTIDTPWLTLYASCKAYMDKLTQDMANEYRYRGIIFQYLLPGYVTTKLSKIRVSTLWTPSPQQFAALAVNSIGLQERSAVWLPHRALAPVSTWLKLFFPKTANQIVTQVMREFWLYGKKREMEKVKKI